VACCSAFCCSIGVTALRLPVAGLAQIMPLRVLRLAGRLVDTARSGADGQRSVTLGLAEALVLLSPGSAQPRPPGRGPFSSSGAAHLAVDRGRTGYSFQLTTVHASVCCLQVPPLDGWYTQLLHMALIAARRDPPGRFPGESVPFRSSDRSYRPLTLLVNSSMACLCCCRVCGV